MNAARSPKDHPTFPQLRPSRARDFALRALPCLLALAGMASPVRAGALYLDYATNGGVTTTGWTPVYLGNGNATLTNVAGSGYTFAFTNMYAYQGGDATQSLTRSGFHNANNTTVAHTFTLSGVLPNKPVKLYACAAWDGNTAGGYIVYGDNAPTGVKAQTVGNPGLNGTLANLTYIGTATADATGMVTGSLHGRNGVGLSGEGQMGAMVFLPTQVITATAGTHGTITNPGDFDVFAGSNLTYDITPDSGYHVTDVVVDGSSVGAVTSYTFTNISANHTIAATFAVDTASYTITASAGANGSISPEGAVSAFEGTNKLFTITPGTGYHVADVLVDGVSVGAVTSYTFTNITGPHEIAASFAINSYNITSSADANGSISPVGTTALTHGTSQTYEITPNAGYYIDAVVVDGVSVGPVSSYTFENISAGHTIAATFDNRTRLLLDFAQTGGSYTNGWNPVYATSLADTMVNVTGVGGTNYNFTFAHVGAYQVGDAIQTLTRSGFYNSGGTTNTHPFTLTGLIPGQGVTLYGCAAWDGNGMGAYVVFGDSGAAGVKALTVGNPGNAPTLGNLTRIGRAVVDATGTVSGQMYGSGGITSGAQGQLGGMIFAIEEAPVWTITASAGSHGSISPAGDVQVTSGQNQSFAITADPGYHVADVLVDGVTVGAVNSYDFNIVTASHTISATFAQNTASFIITASAGEHGSISPAGSVSVNQGVNKLFTITADPGYHVADVLVDGASVGAVSSYTFIGVTGNHSISASFAVNTYVVEASAVGGGAISPAGNNVINEGDSQTFTFTPEAGYYVDYVLVDGASVGAVASYTFENVTANHSISVHYENRTQLKLDFTQTGDLNFTSGWIPVYAGIQTDTMVNATNLGGLGYGFTCDHVAVWNTGLASQPLTRAGFYNIANIPTPSARPFKLTGLAPGQAVTLYACAGWDGNERGATIVFGDSGASGKRARTIGSPGLYPTLANMTLIGSAAADAGGEVSGTLHGTTGVDTATEGQVGGFVFVLEAAGTLADADGDGMDDSWENTYFGGTAQTAAGDFDQDGTDNLTEFRLGLVPNNGTSVFAASLDASGLLEWQSVVGVTFAIERSTSLTDGTWEVLEAAYPGTAGSASYTDPAPPAGRAFYRIKLNP